MYVLQSTAEPTLFFNGTVLGKRGLNWALFDATNRREFDTYEEAQSVSEVFDVPVNIMEV